MKRITRSIIKIPLKRSLSSQEIWNRIIGIQIQALESLIEDKDLSKWENIFPCYGCSLAKAENLAKDYIGKFKNTQGEVFNNEYHKVESLLLSLNTQWFNTLMSTLYMMEEDLMETSMDSVFTLWDIFFTCQALRKENHVSTMGLNNFKLIR